MSNLDFSGPTVVLPSLASPSDDKNTSSCSNLPAPLVNNRPHNTRAPPSHTSSITLVNSPNAISSPAHAPNPFNNSSLIKTSPLPHLAAIPSRPPIISSRDLHSTATAELPSSQHDAT